MAERKAVHYLNQFFGGIGGEEAADTPPRLKSEPVGPAGALNAQLDDCCEVVSTIICGDDYFSENEGEALAAIEDMLTDINPDIIIAGPAFNAGRYGMACGAVAQKADELGLPVVSGIYPENPGYEMYRNHAYFVETPDSAAGMRDALPDMASLVKRYFETDGNPGGPEEADYLPRGLRKNIFVETRGARRAVDMLLNKIKEEDYKSEYPMPAFDTVKPAEPLTDLSQAKIALVTSGGIVPDGNPDSIEASSASKYGKYSLKEFDDLSEDSHDTAHGGYDPVYASEDADRVLPLDVMRELEEEGEIGELHDYFYTTVGNGTAVASAREFAQDIASDLEAADVEGVVLTST
ncbi:glycine reductase [Halarsenatibacter silvermanii]|uniref:Glycine reductase n=1 Tax=Halarsenatibacter silvermanii TaxID=321763 RepID=A0A1G9N280_9FIRM|nr:glycine reductase [Halarsenatibacter silvermanii]